MSQVSAVLRRGVDNQGGAYYIYWCPGCEHAHSIPVDSPTRPSWSFDGNLESPTFGPSVRHFMPARERGGGYEPIPEKTFCHYFIKAGQIEYCGDCTHALNGQTVPMVHLNTITDYGWGDGDD